MKYVLITGANSYIGESFKEWAEKRYTDEFVIDVVDMLDEDWSEKDFSGYDVIFHVAGIVHQKETKENAKLYYQVNRDLAIAVAKKAKKSKVKQFILLSSMSVYGKNEGVITKETIENPQSNYGKSKFQADNRIKKMNNVNFKVVILRPPVIYGRGCKGNYVLLSSLARKLRVFPNIKNKRSMLYIDNLSEYICLLIKNEESGMFFPQNESYVQTCQMVRMIAEARGKKLRLCSILNPFVKLLGVLPGKLGDMEKKAFGNLIYEKELSKYKDNYCLANLEESIRLSER